MAGDENRGGPEREARFVNILQPNRDLATNWTVDVGKELENYLAELASTGIFDDGQCALNFAEAALLIQGSIQVYSRKVEYLYALVLQALNFIGQKKQGEEENSSSQYADQGAEDVAENEEEFLNLDDVQEEANIDILEEEGVGSVHSVIKIPASLLAAEAEPIDLSGEAGELATYEIATSTLYRTFLLLDPSDVEAVDRYLDGEGDVAHETSLPTPGSASRGRTPRSKGPTPGKKTGSAQKRANPEPTTEGRFDSEPDWHGDCGDGAMNWDDPNAGNRQGDEGPINHVTGEDHGVADSDTGVEKDDYIDPWAPLNPHGSGTLTVKPFKKGLTQRKKPKVRKERMSSLSVASRTGVCFPEFLKALQSRERLERATRRRQEPEEIPSFEILRSSFQNSDAGLAADAADERNGGGSGDHEGDESDNWDGPAHDMSDSSHDNVVDSTQTLEPSDLPQQPGSTTMYSPYMNVPSFGDGREGEEMSFEDLCRAHLDSMLQKLEEARVRSGLANRVTKWKNKIEATLIEQDSRPPFDIHEYGDRLLDELATLAARSQDDEEEVQESFTYLVRGQQCDQVARSFAALLQLVNNGNVVIDKGEVGGESYCFTGEKPFTVKLLTSQNKHEGMFENMIPAKTTKNLGKSKAARPPQSTERSRSKQNKFRVVHENTNLVSEPRSPTSPSRSRSSLALSMSPGSVRISSRKRRQGVGGKRGTPDKENRGFSTPLHPTPVKLTPDGRQRSRRRPLAKIVQ